MNGKVLRAKYQINPNIFVQCYLDVIQTDGDQLQVHVGIKRKADTRLTVGIKFLVRPEDSEGLLEKTTSVEGGFETVVLQIKEVFEESDGKFVHVCKSVKHEVATERRKEPRVPSRFFLQQVDSDAKLQVNNATLEGLGMSYKSTHAMVNLNLQKTYEFLTYHKSTEYRVKGQICHILYNWKTYEHTVGLALEPIADEDLLTVLKILIDPDYTVRLNQREKIDASEGKVSKLT